MRIRDPQISCADINAIEGADRLSTFAKRRLYLRLVQIRLSYRLGKNERDQAAPSEVSKLLESFRSSITKMATLRVTFRTATGLR